METVQFKQLSTILDDDFLDDFQKGYGESELFKSPRLEKAFRHLYCGRQRSG